MRSADSIQRLAMRFVTNDLTVDLYKGKGALNEAASNRDIHLYDSICKIVLKIVRPKLTLPFIHILNI